MNYHFWGFSGFTSLTGLVVNVWPWMDFITQLSWAQANWWRIKHIQSNWANQSALMDLFHSPAQLHRTQKTWALTTPRSVVTGPHSPWKLMWGWMPTKEHQQINSIYCCVICCQVLWTQTFARHCGSLFKTFVFNVMGATEKLFHPLHPQKQVLVQIESIDTPHLNVVSPFILIEFGGLEN